MYDDGTVVARTRLVRPMGRETISLDEFARSHSRPATRDPFAPLWEAECARSPEFAESEFHIITGLLLPIWDRLPAENMRVYRFETNDGERVIGRFVTPEALDRVYGGLGASQTTSPISSGRSSTSSTAGSTASRQSSTATSRRSAARRLNRTAPRSSRSSSSA